jgi:hypothetical protein
MKRLLLSASLLLVTQLSQAQDFSYFQLVFSTNDLVYEHSWTITPDSIECYYWSDELEETQMFPLHPSEWDMLTSIAESVHQDYRKENPPVSGYNFPSQLIIGYPEGVFKTNFDSQIDFGFPDRLPQAFHPLRDYILLLAQQKGCND